MGASVDKAPRKPTKQAAKGVKGHAVVRPRGRAALKSNLLEELIKAREDEFRTVANLAEMAGLAPEAVAELEAGRGPVSTLTAVSHALPFKVAGLAKGATLAEKLRNGRGKKGFAVEELAAKAAVSPDEVVALDAGGGSIESLLRVLAVIAPRVRRHALERSHWGPGDQEARDARFTPEWFLRIIEEVFGDLDLDPCGHALSPVRAHRRFLLSEGDDGLRDAWTGGVAFMNPPFSCFIPWMTRAHDEWSRGHVRTVLCLVPVRTDSELFHERIASDADIFLLRGRLPFSDTSGKSLPTPFSLMLVGFGITAAQKVEFARRVRGFWVKGFEGVAELERELAPTELPSAWASGVWPQVAESRCDRRPQASRPVALRDCCWPKVAA